LVQALAPEARAVLVTKPVEYRQDGAVCRGYPADDDA